VPCYVSTLRRLRPSPARRRRTTPYRLDCSFNIFIAVFNTGRHPLHQRPEHAPLCNCKETTSLSDPEGHYRIRNAEVASFLHSSVTASLDHITGKCKPKFYQECFGTERPGPIKNYILRTSSVGIATGYGLQGWGSSPVRLSYFSLFHSVQTGSGAHVSIKWVLGAPSIGAKRPIYEADHSLPPNAELKNSSIHQWLYNPLLGPGLYFSSILFFYTDGRTPWTSDQPVAWPLPTYRVAQTQNKRTQTTMPSVRFEPTIPVFERAKTVHALDRAATVIGSRSRPVEIYLQSSIRLHSLVLKQRKNFNFYCSLETRNILTSWANSASQEECRLENRARRIFERNIHDVAVGWRKLNNMELHNLYF
jgi:hypothetical protein